MSDTVRVGDTVNVWNDETRFYDDKMSYHCPGVPEWLAANGTQGDGSPVTVYGPTAAHIYQEPGNYQITLEFTDAEGATAVDTRVIKVLPLSGGQKA